MGSRDIGEDGLMEGESGEKLYEGGENFRNKIK